MNTKTDSYLDEFINTFMDILRDIANNTLYPENIYSYYDDNKWNSIKDSLKQYVQQEIQNAIKAKDLDYD